MEKNRMIIYTMLSFVNNEDRNDKHDIAKVRVGRKTYHVYYYSGMKEPLIKGEYSKKILLDEHSPEFELVLRTDGQRNNLYTCGKSGSGKSYMSGQIARGYSQINKKNPVYLISGVDEDEAYDGIKTLKRLNIEEITEDPINDLSELSNSMVIFDDVEALPKSQIKALELLADMIYTRGRHHNITVNTIRHNVTDYKKTRTLLQ